MCFSLLLLWDILKSLNDNESGRKKNIKNILKIKPRNHMLYPFLLWCNNLFLFNTNTISLCWRQSNNELVIRERCQSFIIIIIIIIIILKSLTNAEKLHSFVVTRLILSVLL